MTSLASGNSVDDPDEAAESRPRTHTVHRIGRGSMRGELAMAEDWDSQEVNEAIARDFGLML